MKFDDGEQVSATSCGRLDTQKYEGEEMGCHREALWMSVSIAPWRDRIFGKGGRSKR
jgi:hypothetical protein